MICRTTRKTTATFQQIITENTLRVTSETHTLSLGYFSNNLGTKNLKNWRWRKMRVISIF